MSLTRLWFTTGSWISPVAGSPLAISTNAMSRAGCESNPSKARSAVSSGKSSRNEACRREGGGHPYRSHHERDVACDGGVGVEDVLEVFGAGAEADGEGEDVDDLVGVGAEEVGAEDPVAVFFHQHFRS